MNIISLMNAALFNNRTRWNSVGDGIKKVKKHNPERYGEIYTHNMDFQFSTLERLKPWIIISGGFAWHFISPPHVEYKHLHDHKDIDIFVSPENFTRVQLDLTEHNFYRMKTKYDSKDFIRYERILDKDLMTERKLVIDMFKGEPPSIEVKGWKLVDPNHLLSLYSVHQSDHCVAVKASRELIKKGIDIIDNEELIKLPI
jgi:hypothetical protein